jgi:hypothetical protein
MARINISIPDETKEKMDKLTGTNWSKIALESFTRHLQLIELKEVNMTESQLERLRQSRDNYKERSNTEGVVLGKEWALNSEFEDVEQVAALADQTFSEDDIQYYLAKALLNDDSLSSNEIKEQMEEIFGTRNPSYEAIEGFIEGVVEVMKQI